MSNVDPIVPIPSLVSVLPVHDLLPILPNMVFAFLSFFVKMLFVKIKTFANKKFTGVPRKRNLHTNN